METKKIKIAGLQMSSIIGDVQANHKKLINLLDTNIKEENIDILVLPEVWTVGWECSNFIDSAEDISNSKTIDLLRVLSKKYNMYIIGGSLITKENGNYYNTCPVISPNGDILTTYKKNHLFSYYGCGEGSYVKCGNSPVIINLLGYNIGLSICYDIRFPELYRAYRKAGADLLINMAAWPEGRKNHWLALTRARAVENQCFMLALTQSGKLADGTNNLGYSLIYDYNGDILNEITSGEGIISTELSTDKMYIFRNKCTVLNDIHKSYEVKIC